MKRYAFLFVVTLLALSSLACSLTINAPTVRSATGPTETMTINEPAPSSGTPHLSIGMGAGKLNVSGGGSSLVTGTVRYNVAEIKPTVERSGNDVNIKQETKRFASIGPDVINEWTLQLGTMPMELTVNAGAYEGTLDLSGVALTRLQINDGASKSKVIFNDPNPQTMEMLTYKTGASEVNLQGLANANFKQMTFGGGAGSYTLDFSGELKQDARVDISSGVSSVKIIIPKGMHSSVEVTGGLNNVEPTGTWTVKDKTYESAGTGPLLTIHVDMGVGNLQLVNE